jgi:predicted nucleic acid-binding protein
MPRHQLAELVAFAADPALRDELAELAPDSTERRATVVTRGLADTSIPCRSTAKWPQRGLGFGSTSATAASASGVNDSWIAATALAHQVPVITQDQGYVVVAGLRVIVV